MNKLFTLLLLPFLAFQSLNSFAQDGHFKCGTSEKMRELYAKNPGMEADRIKLIQNSKTNKSKSTIDTLVIPVVFHIIHEYGVENIPDANVYDQMEVLNRDYMRKNADTNQVIPAFDTMIGKVFIQFQLASKDPWGNCTNGINHIYSHETMQGNDDSKLNNWRRSTYLNVWVVDKMRDGVAGYAYYPSDGLAFYVDGIIILKDHIGRLAPASENNSRSLTHEVGHYLGLSHTWGDSNEPMLESNCNIDDGLEDTPNTRGYNYCPANGAASMICSPPNPNAVPPFPGIAENYQNYMDYSYCSYMFTPDQVDLMRYNLQNTVGQRDDLITDSVHALAGITPYVNPLSPPLCTPVADFGLETVVSSSQVIDKHYICQGGSVSYVDRSWRAAVASRIWTFEGGTPATSTSASQVVTYDTPGYKKVTLSVTNANGTDVVVKENFIYVTPNWSDFVGPKSLDLNDGFVHWFLKDNPEDNEAKFDIHYANGIDNSYCFKLNNFKNIVNPSITNPDYFYNARLGGNRDGLISPSFDLSNTSNVNISFKYAYATNATVSADITENVKVYTSKNCGQTWTLRKTLSAGTLVTAGYAGFTNFTPQTNAQWKECTFPLSVTSTDDQVRVKIEFNSSDLSSNFYVDNFNISGTLGLFSNEIESLELSVFPNPVSSDQSITVSYKAGDNPVELILRDIQGKVIYNKTIAATHADVTHTLELANALSATCYFLEVKSGDFSSVKKIVVL
jgi:PKD repeat protein